MLKILGTIITISGIIVLVLIYIVSIESGGTLYDSDYTSLYPLDKANTTGYFILFFDQFKYDPPEGFRYTVRYNTYEEPSVMKIKETYFCIMTPSKAYSLESRHLASYFTSFKKLKNYVKKNSIICIKGERVHVESSIYVIRQVAHEAQINLYEIQLGKGKEYQPIAIGYVEIVNMTSSIYPPYVSEIYGTLNYEWNFAPGLYHYSRALALTSIGLILLSLYYSRNPEVKPRIVEIIKNKFKTFKKRRK